MVQCVPRCSPVPNQRYYLKRPIRDYQTTSLHGAFWELRPGSTERSDVQRWNQKNLQANQKSRLLNLISYRLFAQVADYLMLLDIRGFNTICDLLKTEPPPVFPSWQDLSAYVTALAVRTISRKNRSRYSSFRINQRRHRYSHNSALT